jgi:hypothetical protein
VHRLDVVQFRDAVPVEPGEKRTCRAVIGLACVAVADRRREELEKAANRFIAGPSDRRRDDEIAGERDGAL